MSRDRIMSIGLLMSIIFLSILLESYSMAIENDMFDINSDINSIINTGLKQNDFTKIKKDDFIV